MKGLPKMMNKIAQDAYLQGTIDAINQLQQTGIVKQAQARDLFNYMVKLSSEEMFMDAEIADKLKNEADLDRIYGRQPQSLAEIAAETAPEREAAEADRLKKRMAEQLEFDKNFEGPPDIGAAKRMMQATDARRNPGLLDRFNNLSPTQKALLAAGGLTAGGLGLAKLLD